jgi:hypothetical protein
MSVDDIGCLPFAAYFQPGTDIGLSYSQQKAALHQLLRQSGPRDVPFVILPKLVRFRDITPQTLVRVSPYDLAASFGPAGTVPTDHSVRSDNCKCIIHLAKQPADASEYQPVNRPKWKSLGIGPPQRVDSPPQHHNLCIERYSRP